MKTKLNLTFLLLPLSLCLSAQESLFEASQKKMKELQEEYRAYIADVSRSAIDLRSGKSIRSKVIHNSSGAGSMEMETIPAERPTESLLPVSAERFIPNIYPVEGDLRISSGYGYRNDPFNHQRTFHGGIDLAVAVGTKVYSTANGQVSKSGYDSRSGRYLIIDHENGYRSSYCHLSVCLVSRGETVRKGQVIARSGASGRVTGPHLHYSVYSGEKTINPLSVIIY